MTHCARVRGLSERKPGPVQRVPARARPAVHRANTTGRPPVRTRSPSAARAPSLRSTSESRIRPAPVTVRQIADLHLLLQSHGQRIDHAWLHRRIEQLEAWTGLRQIRDAIGAKRLGTLLSWGEFGRLIEVGVARADALSTQRTRNPRIGTFLKNSFDSLPGPRTDDVAAKLARAPWLVSRVLGAGYRVRGEPVSTRTFDAPRFMRIDGALYLATGAGLILLSLVDLDDGARAKLAERVRTGGRPVVLARWTAERARAGTR